MEKPSPTFDSGKTNRQWAWEFLRRNPSYREAYAFLWSLNADQKDILFKIMDGDIDWYSEHWSQIGALPLKLFDNECLNCSKDDDRTLDEYINEPGNPFINPTRKKQGLDDVIDDLVLRVRPEYRGDHYGLHVLVDPEFDKMTAEMADQIWFYSVPLEAALERSPWLDDAGISFDKFEWDGQTLDDLMNVEKIDYESASDNKSRPVQSEMLPLKRGVNGAIFTINDFSSPSSFFEASGKRIPIGRDPGPLSLDGDTLVRVTFDVSIPLEYQIANVRDRLTVHQQELQEAGFIDSLPSRKSRPGVFASYITVLDLREQGLSDLEIAKTLCHLEDETYTDAQGNASRVFFDAKKPDRVTSQEHTTTIRKQLERARYLRDHGYRSLALQPD